MIVRWPESIFSHEPAWWENNEVKHGLTWLVALHSKDCEDTRIRVIIRYGAHGVELVQVVLHWVVVSVPGNYIERAMALFVGVHFPTEANHHFPVSNFIDVMRHWRLEVSFVCKAIRTDGSKVGDLEMASINL